MAELTVKPLIVQGIEGATNKSASAYEADPEKRRDLSQNIHFQLWRSFQRYDARCSLRTWTYRVAHHVAASHVLRQRRIFSKLVSLEELEMLPDKSQVQFAADQKRNLAHLSALIQQLAQRAAGGVLHVVLSEAPKNRFGVSGPQPQGGGKLISSPYRYWMIFQLIGRVRIA
jgi:hypothetical protein